MEAEDIAQQLKNVYGDRFFENYLGLSRIYQENEINELMWRLKLFIRQQSIKPPQAVIDALPSHPININQSRPLKEKARRLLSSLGLVIVNNPSNYPSSGLYIAPRTAATPGIDLVRPAIIPSRPNYMKYMQGPSRRKYDLSTPARTMGGRRRRRRRRGRGLTSRRRVRKIQYNKNQ